MINKISVMVISGILTILSLECVAYRPPRQAPPPRRVVVRGARPGQGYIWDKGHWAWRHGRYRWVNGHWTKKRRGKSWVPGHWVKIGAGWKWISGHWR